MKERQRDGMCLTLTREDRTMTQKCRQQLKLREARKWILLYHCQAKTTPDDADTLIKITWVRPMSDL